MIEEIQIGLLSHKVEPIVVNWITLEIKKGNDV